MKTKRLFSTTLETGQWFIYLLASTVAMPIVIGAIFEMSAIEIAGFMQRTIFIVGIASLLQVLIGHKLPIVEGPAGVWVSIFSVMALTGIHNGESFQQSLRTLEGMVIVTGIFLFLFGIFKISEKFLFIFTPLVTGTFFLLLTVQLSGTFLKGMLGLQGDTNTIQLGDAALSFLTFFIVLGLSVFAKNWLKSYAVLIGILIGWVLYIIFIGNPVLNISVPIFSVPEVFAFGLPHFTINSVPTAFLTAIILISNLVASIVAMEQTIHGKSYTPGTKVNRGTTLSGFNHMLAGVFSSVANVPLAISSGFVAMTGQKRKAPFIYASILVIIIVFFPPIVSLLSSIPAGIANGAIMATFIQLVGLAINNVTSEPLDTRKITILGIAYLIGMGTMFLPPEVFATIPSIFQNVLNNGLLVGTALVIILEQTWKVREKDKAI